jgi:general secretion pathway protein G
MGRRGPALSERRRAARVEGFTLVELLLVIIIIGTLAAIVVPRFVGRGEDARIAAAQQQLSNFATSLEQFMLYNQDKYPTTEQGLQALRVQPQGMDEKRWRGPYMSKDIPADPWGRAYAYECPGTHNPKGYDCWSSGPDGISGNEDDITSWGSGS